MQTQRNLPDGADVVRHVLAVLAIAPGGGLHQQAIFVTQAHGQTVKFELGDVLHRGGALRQLQLFADAGVKGLRATGLRIGFGADAEHGHGMAHAVKLRQGFAAYALGRRVGGAPLGVLGL